MACSQTSDFIVQKLMDTARNPQACIDFPLKEYLMNYEPYLQTPNFPQAGHLVESAGKIYVRKVDYLKDTVDGIHKNTASCSDNIAAAVGKARKLKKQPVTGMEDGYYAKELKCKSISELTEKITLSHAQDRRKKIVLNLNDSNRRKMSRQINLLKNNLYTDSIFGRERIIDKDNDVFSKCKYKVFMNDIDPYDNSIKTRDYESRNEYGGSNMCSHNLNSNRDGLNMEVAREQFNKLLQNHSLNTSSGSPTRSVTDLPPTSDDCMDDLGQEASLEPISMPNNTCDPDMSETAVNNTCDDDTLEKLADTGDIRRPSDEGLSSSPATGLDVDISLTTRVLRVHLVDIMEYLQIDLRGNDKITVRLSNDGTGEKVLFWLFGIQTPEKNFLRIEPQKLNEVKYFQLPPGIKNMDTKQQDDPVVPLNICDKPASNNLPGNDNPVIIDNNDTGAPQPDDQLNTSITDIQPNNEDNTVAENLYKPTNESNVTHCASLFDSGCGDMDSQLGSMLDDSIAPTFCDLMESTSYTSFDRNLSCSNYVNGMRTNDMEMTCSGATNLENDLGYVSMVSEAKAANNEMTQRVNQWHESLRTVLQLSEKRNHFNIYEAGTNIINVVKERQPEAATFADVVTNQEQGSTANYFLSLLQLVSIGLF